MKLNPDLLLVCSAAQLPHRLTVSLAGASLHALVFSSQHICACMRAWRAVPYLPEWDRPQRVEPPLWLNNALCVSDQVIYMRCDRTPPDPSGHCQPAPDFAFCTLPPGYCAQPPPHISNCPSILFIPPSCICMGLGLLLLQLHH